MGLFAWIKSWFSKKEVTPVVEEPKVELTEWEKQQLLLSANGQITKRQWLGAANGFRPAGASVDRSPDGDDMIASVYLASVAEALETGGSTNTNDSSSNDDWSGGGGTFNGGGASGSWDDSSSSSSDSSYDSGSSDSGGSSGD